MKNLYIYNSLVNKLQLFKPNNDSDVKIYICGPTVYDSPHMGHARTYISFDIIKRVLKYYFSYEITDVMNITNIDDKIIARAREMKISYRDLSSMYEEEFFKVMDILNVSRPAVVTRVDEYILEIIEFIEKLINNGYAYERDESVYFNIASYREKHRYNLLKRGEEKDFVLWKASDDLRFESPWGPGRPGWHIECSVMASDIFGSELDIHIGGIDLAFPHHENEIAQCRAYFEQDEWVKYLLHTGHLNIDGLKMSKSLKNFFTISEILDKYSPEAIRILFIQHKWNTPMNYDPKQLDRAELTKRKIFNFTSNIEHDIDTHKSDLKFNGKMFRLFQEFKLRVDSALCSNINTQKALEELTSFITVCNTHLKEINVSLLKLILKFVKRLLYCFGLDVKQNRTTDDDNMVVILNNFRSKVRISAMQKVESKKYLELCDTVRRELRDLGYEIQDKKTESRIKQMSN